MRKHSKKLAKRTMSKTEQYREMASLAPGEPTEAPSGEGALPEDSAVGTGVWGLQATVKRGEKRGFF